MVTIGNFFSTILQYWYILLGAVAVAIVIFAVWFIKRKAKAKLQEKRHEVSCLLFEGDTRRKISVPAADIKDFATMRFKVLDKQPVYLIQPFKPPAPGPIPEPQPEPEPHPECKIAAEVAVLREELRTVHHLSKKGRALRAQIKTLTDGNGHQPQAEAGKALAITTPVEIVAPAFQYEPWHPNPVPEGCEHMTPNWLYRGIHWEEQAKVARVKNSGLSPTLKFGAIVVVLVLAVITIFLFGVILMDKA